MNDDALAARTSDVNATMSAPPSRPAELRSELASERVKVEIGAFLAEVKRWAWTDDDPRADCGTHAQALRDVAVGAASTLMPRVDAVAQPDPGDRLRALRDIERELGVIRAIWAHLRVMIDARTQPVTGPLLRAADELVWSLHRGAMSIARGGAEPPVPLVTVGPEWGAEMVPVPRIALNTRGTAATAAVAILDRLRIREIRLPWAAVGEPWLLALVLHEVGHAIEFDLVPDGTLLTAFATALADAVGGPRAQRWRGWADEVFADACAVAAAGPAILPALVAWETTTLARLASSASLADRYPPPVVRWNLVRAFCTQLGLPAGDPPAITASLSPDRGLRDLLDDLPAVVAVLDQPLPLVARRLRDLWPDTAALLGDPVTQKQADLQADQPFPDDTMSGARAALVAAVGVATAGPAAAASYGPWRQQLAARVVALIGACHGPGTRGSGDLPPAGPAAALLGSLAREAREEADHA
jgi:hypothetical protein